MGKKNKSAELSVFFGPMFSGKTSYLVEDIVRSEIAGFEAVIFKPYIDDRGEGRYLIRSRSGVSREAVPVNCSSDILKKVSKEIEVVGLDEAQFFDGDIVSVVEELTKHRGVRVVVSGLPSDFRGEPFGALPILMAKADRLVQLTAVCTHFKDRGENRKCEIPATRTQRIINGQPALWDSPIVQVGNEELYVARCRRHHIVPGHP